MIEILFFAQVREIIGIPALQLPAEFSTVDDLRTSLMARGDRWALALESGKLLVAVNQTLTNMAHPLKAGDEVAFFPPVTGG